MSEEVGRERGRNKKFYSILSPYKGMQINIREKGSFEVDKPSKILIKTLSVTKYIESEIQARGIHMIV